MTQSYLYAATFEPGFVKVGRSILPKQRVQALRTCQQGAYPANADLSTGTLIMVRKETGQMSESVAHRQLRDHLAPRCHEWFIDSDIVREKLASMGFCTPNDRLLDRYTIVTVNLPRKLRNSMKSRAKAAGCKLHLFYAETLAKALGGK